MAGQYPKILHRILITTPMAEWSNATDLRSVSFGSAGSNPARGILRHLAAIHNLQFDSRGRGFESLLNFCWVAQSVERVPATYKRCLIQQGPIAQMVRARCL